MPAYVATVTRGAEDALATELAALGMKEIRTWRGAVMFHGGLEDGYRACLWSRVASRILLRLKRVPAVNADVLYDSMRTLPWADHIGPDTTFAVDFVGVSGTIRNSRFGALRTKDAIVDSLRDLTGSRPSVDLANPDVRVNVHLSEGKAAVSIDMSGAPLHIRGSRVESGPANLKENLAAALLILADWPARAARGEPLFDPMCGSGTFLTEGAAMAAGRAPGLTRERWGFERWRGHDAALWTEIHAAAQDRTDREIPSIRGSDQSRSAIADAWANIEALEVPVHVERRSLSEVEAPTESAGLFVTNPPYGERIGADEDVAALHREIGDTLRRRFLGWTGFVLTTLPLSKRIGLRPKRRHIIHNGPIECRFVEIPISGERVQRDQPSV